MENSLNVQSNTTNIWIPKDEIYNEYKDNTNNEIYINYINEAKKFLIINNLHQTINVEDVLCKKNINKLIDRTFAKLLNNFDYFVIFETDYNKNDLNNFINIDKYFDIKQYIHKNDSCRANYYKIISIEVSKK
jgi:hypothetical protein